MTITNLFGRKFLTSSDLSKTHRAPLGGGRCQKPSIGFFAELGGAHYETPVSFCSATLIQVKKATMFVPLYLVFKSETKRKKLKMSLTK